MEWLSGIIAFFKALPELIKIIREIWGVIAEANNAKEKKERAKQLGEGIAKAKRDKDTSGLDEWFGVPSVPADSNGGEQMQRPTSGT